MSGVAAAFALGAPPPEGALQRAVDAMAAAQRHRGEAGTRHADPFAVMATLSGVIARRGPLVAAGEVRLDRPDDLAAALGVDRRGLSDAELVLAGWERWGDVVVDRAHGDLALIVRDTRERTPIALRDALGVKPLYFARAGDVLLVASEMHALLATGLLPPVALDRTQAARWLTFDYAEEGPTLFRGIFAAQPGGVTIFRRDGEERRRAWRPDPFLPARSRDLRECAEALRDALDGAVRARLRDAPGAAVLVSGGLDSSTVACLAARQAEAAGATPPPLLHLAFPGLACDEATYIAAVVETTRARLVEIDARRDALAASPAHNQLGPAEIFDASLVPMDGLFDAAALPRGTVLLSGLGGDDLVHDTGLDAIDALRALDLRAAISAARRRRPQGRSLGGHLAGQLAIAFAPTRLRDLVRRARRSWPGWLTPAAGEALHAWHVARMAWRETVDAPSEVQRRYALLLLGDSDLFHFLSRLDRLFSRRGLDARHPFYDRRVVDELLRTPNHVRFAAWDEKDVLREAMRGILPEKVRTREDPAVFVPFFQENLRRTHREAYRAAFAHPELERAGVVRPGALIRLLEEEALPTVLQAIGLEVAFRTAAGVRAS